LAGFLFATLCDPHDTLRSQHFFLRADEMNALRKALIEAQTPPSEAEKLF
jgi:hypothetical protein